MPELKIEMWPVDGPKDYPANARKWSKRAIDAVGLSLLTYGFRQPIVVDKDGVIVIGHLRRAAAKAKGMRTIPVHVASDLTPEQIRGLRLADNRTHEESSWDVDLLMPELTDLKAAGFDLAFTGFDSKEIGRFLGFTDDKAGEDQAPPAPDVPTSEHGDLWACGDHRVLCGDSTDTVDVGRLLNGDKADLVYTDPPYGVDFTGAKYNPRAKHWAGIRNDERTGGDLEAFLGACFANLVSHAHPASPVYCWAAAMEAMLVALKAAGVHVQSQIIWVKNCIVLGQADYQWKHEQCWYGWTPGKKHAWNGGRALSTVWEISKDSNASYEHPCQKPVSLAQRAIENSCNAGARVLDMFGGSGATLIACEKMERRGYLMEMETKYVDVIVKRWELFSGKTATLEGDGRTFEEIKAHRFGARLGGQDLIYEDAERLLAERQAAIA